MNDEEKVNQLIDKVSVLFSLAVRQGDRKTLRILVKISCIVIDIKALYEAFGGHPRVSGRKGVDQCLGISRNGVYCKLNEAGLAPEDFQERSASVYSLIRKSHTLKPLLMVAGGITL